MSLTFEQARTNFFPGDNGGLCLFVANGQGQLVEYSLGVVAATDADRVSGRAAEESQIELRSRPNAQWTLLRSD